MRLFFFSLPLLFQAPLLGETPYGLTPDEYLNQLDQAQRLHWDHEMHQADYWKESTSKPFEERMIPLDQKLRDFLYLENTLQGQVDPSVKEAVYDEEFQKDLLSAIRELPYKVKNLLWSQLVGFCLLRDLATEGRVSSFVDKEGKVRAGMILLDQEKLDKTANELALEQSKAFFYKHPDYQMEVMVEKPAEDQRKHAIQFILLRLLGQVLSYEQDSKFFSISWKSGVNPGQYESVFDHRFTRRKVLFSAGRKIYSLKDAAELYEDLKKTDYQTLAAARSPTDDFAESFRAYVHVHLLKKPYRVRVWKEDSLLSESYVDWRASRFKRKKKFFDALFRSAN